MSNFMWLNVGSTYKCYRNCDGKVLGGVREHEGTFNAYVLGEFVGEYISQETAVNAILETLSLQGEDFD